jgi:autotransporter-associated beta strand protein
MKTLIVAAIRCSFIFLVPTVSYAISAQWDLDPISGDWNTAANWTPNGVPNGPADIATFGLSNTTGVSISANTEVNSIVFTPAATNPYTITADHGLTLIISGVGITNNSGVTQNFVSPGLTNVGSAGLIRFTNSATAGSQTKFTNEGASLNGNGGLLEFYDNSNAGSSTVINNGSTSSVGGATFTFFFNTSSAANGTFTNNSSTITGGNGGTIVFGDDSTAANGTFTNSGGANSGFNFNGATVIIFNGNSTAADATILNNGGTVIGAQGGSVFFGAAASAGNATITNNSATAAFGYGGITNFFNDSTAANATIVNNGGTISGARGGQTFFGGQYGAPSAGNATIINNGASATGAGGSKTIFDNTSTAGDSLLIANGGTNGGEGGAIFFEGHSSGGTSEVEVFGNGALDISAHNGPGVTIGSIEGDGIVFLGRRNLTVGGNNVSTTFSGLIQDGGQNDGTGGSLTKIGLGTLELTGANTYTGNTNVRDGVLKVNGSITSDTFVKRRSSTLAGTGTINASLTAFHGIVSPGDPTGMLVVVHDYTQTQYATLMIQIAGVNPDEFGVLNVLGNANLNGFLDPVLLNGFVPSIGDSFVFLNYASLSGEFSHIKHRIFDNGMLQWSVIYETDHAILTVEAHTPGVPDQGSTFLLLTLSLLGLVVYRRQLLRTPS